MSEQGCRYASNDKRPGENRVWRWRCDGKPKEGHVCYSRLLGASKISWQIIPACLSFGKDLGVSPSSTNDRNHRVRPSWFPFVNAPCRTSVNCMVTPDSHSLNYQRLNCSTQTDHHRERNYHQRDPCPRHFQTMSHQKGCLHRQSFRDPVYWTCEL